MSQNITPRNRYALDQLGREFREVFPDADLTFDGGNDLGVRHRLTLEVPEQDAEALAGIFSVLSDSRLATATRVGQTLEVVLKDDNRVADDRRPFGVVLAHRILTAPETDE